MAGEFASDSSIPPATLVLHGASSFVMYIHNQDRNIREFWSNSEPRGAEIVPEPINNSGKASAPMTELAAPREGSGVGTSRV